MLLSVNALRVLRVPRGENFYSSMLNGTADSPDSPDFPDSADFCQSLLKI